jgi:dTDP-glucose 4,6-dehydratase
LEATRQYWLDGPGKLLPIKRFHHISTDEVYGSLASDDLAWTEESPYLPHSPYSASKAASDLLVKAYGHTYGLPYTLTNCTNNYGPFQFPEKLIPLVILNALEGKPLPVYGDGQQIRDWLHVQDHCEAITLVLGKGLPGSSYNVGGGNQPPNLVIVEMVCDLLDELDPHPARVPHRQFIQFVPDRPGHDRRYALNFQKIQQELGWQPRHSIEQGIRDTIAWYIAHTDWVATIRKQKDYRTWLVDNYSRR